MRMCRVQAADFQAQHLKGVNGRAASVRMCMCCKLSDHQTPDTDRQKSTPTRWCRRIAEEDVHMAELSAARDEMFHTQGLLGEVQLGSDPPKPYTERQEARRRKKQYEVSAFPSRKWTHVCVCVTGGARSIAM
jgi:hypothetical protein